MGAVPRRDDIESILIIGSGPIVIGQACEFDYSGTQACRVLRAEGFRVILANSNPATIMTDPEVADATYVEPLDAAVVASIVERERPDALLPTLGGQTGLNLAMELVAGGVLEANGTELIGADAAAIATAEDRWLFKQAMLEIGLDVPRSGVARDADQAREVLRAVGLPVIVRPAYILGGRGAGIATTAEEFEHVAAAGLEASPISEVLIEESIVGWKEFELEVMRDRADNCVVVCSIENLDPMGVHTGDSITVAPAQTLSDPEYQQMRNAAFAVLRRVGVETGGSNVQFAVDPATGRQVVIEMNPRVSRSSALASKATGVDPWFLDQISRIGEERRALEMAKPETMDRARWRRAKRLGFSDAQLAYLWGAAPGDVRAARESAGVLPTFKTVDTCAAEFEASTPYHYSTYEDTDEIRPACKPRVVILGSGPNRIGQGIEFDYCCVHAGQALRAAGYETVMVNCNPETVSTDYDTNDRLYFEPLTDEDVANVIAAEDPVGVIVSLGGQTPLALAGRLPPELVLGTPPASIEEAEDRERWNALCTRLGIPQPPGGTATSQAEALEVATRIGYPVLVRPSYVLGGRAMAIVYDDDELAAAMDEVADFGSLGREGGPASERPVLVDRFLEDATEVDVDAVRDRTGEVQIGAVMEHVEEAGVHSGDSACTIPPTTLPDDVVAAICDHTRRIAAALDVKGLLNVQFAVKRNGNGPPHTLSERGSSGASDVFVIEANPRASRTVPFVAKATGVPLAMVAARLMVGATLSELRAEGMLPAASAGLHEMNGYVAVKEAVLPFNRFPGADAVLGPEMRSTGEVMALDVTPGLAFVKAQLAAGTRLPAEGTVFMSMADRDKEAGLRAARIFHALGYRLAATAGTAQLLRRGGVPVAVEVAKLGDNEGRHAVDLIEAGEVQLVVNSPRGRGPRADGAHIRSAAGRAGLPLVTTGAAAVAAADGLRDLRDLRGLRPTVRSLQEYHRSLRGTA